MALTKISEGGFKDDAASQAKIADEAVDEARLQISNAGTNGQFLSKQSGNTGGLTWATVTVPDSDKIEEGNTSVETVDTGSDGHVKISTEGSERVRVDENGDVAVGTASAARGPLHIHKAGSDCYFHITNGDTGTGSGDGFTIHQGGTETLLNNREAGNMRLYTSGTERLRIGSAGQLGIGGATYGTSGQVLTSGGSGAAPSWADAGGGVDSDAQSNTVGGTGPGDAFTSTAYSNTLFGKYAGQYITTGDNNTIIGYQNAHGVTTGGKNTIIGSGVGQDGSTTTRVYEGNTFIGHNLAQSVTSGSYNIAIGKGAANDLTTGSYNIYMGGGAGYAAAGATYQIGIGDDALKNCTATTQNIGIGYKAGRSTTSGNKNIYIGTQAGYNNTGSTQNTFIGYEAGYNALREECTAVGYYSSRYTNGIGNTFLGNRAGVGNSGHSGLSSYNTGIGNSVFVSLAGGAMKNTSVGNESGVMLSTGDENTFIGQSAGYNVSTGSNNTFIGNGSGTSNSPSGSVQAGNNIICLGDGNVGALYCADTSISSSDSRDKTDVNNFTHGLSWINKLNPVTYKWDKRTWYNEYNEDGSFKAAGTPDGTKKRARQHIGFLAQDVLAIEQADGYASKKDDMLVVNLNEDETAYGLKYERLVPVLVNAIKELSTEVNTLKTKVAALESA